MPMYDFTCEVCGAEGRGHRSEGQSPPRFCGRKCMATGMAGVSRKRIKWPISDEMHEQIKKLYQTKVGMTTTPVIREYAKSVGYPNCRIKRYAQGQGWATRQKRDPDWSNEEKAILSRNAHYGLRGIQRKLKAAGFSRTITAINLKKKRMRLRAIQEGYSACQVAEGLGIDAHSVTRWIKQKRLRAMKRQTLRTARNGGDSYHIRDIWVRNFILENLSEIDLRKVDKYWFVDLLAGGDSGLGPLWTEKISEAEE